MYGKIHSVNNPSGDVHITGALAENFRLDRMLKKKPAPFHAIPQLTGPFFEICGGKFSGVKVDPRNSYSNEWEAECRIFPRV